MDCFNLAATVPMEALTQQILPAHTIYHVYWRADLQAFNERQMITLQSILRTQAVDSSSVILWTNAEERLRKLPQIEMLIREHGERFSLRQLDIQELSQGTPMDQHSLLRFATDARAWLDGDLVRLLLLYRFGGAWVDMDVIMTRDLRPLLETEWVIQWDCYDKPYSPLNGALMHFWASSPYLCEMLHAMATGPAPRKGTTDWGSLLYHKVWRRLLENGRKPFEVLPWCFVDGRNCRLDNRLPDPFKADPSMSASQSQLLQRKVTSVVSPLPACMHEG